MSRCAIYARFSTDRQSETSAEDQVRECRRRADAEGWEIVQVYTDLAISGANIRRPGMTAMLADAAAGAFDIVLAEDLDRIARDLEDVSGIYKRLRFADVQLVTLANGTVDELQIGFKGTMDALELGKLKDKIRRGQRGSLARGRIPGSLCYGYDVVREFDERGQVDAGRRRINLEQAAVVLRILGEYADDKPTRAICRDLNREGIPSPFGREWRPSAITGNRARQIGVLHNPIYVGRFVWNRVTMKRDPETRGRVSRVNRPEERVVTEFPELRIATDELWQRVQDRLDRAASQPLTRRRRPKHLLSGLVKCDVCQGNFALIGDNRLACSRARQAGTCDNRRPIRMPELQRRVLAGLDEQLLSAEAVSLLVREFHEQRAKRERQDRQERQGIERRLAAAESAVGRLVAAIADGGSEFAELREALTRKVGERDALRAALEEAESDGVIALRPEIVDRYREWVRRLMAEIEAGRPLADFVKAELRSLIEAVYVKPDPAGGHEVRFTGSFSAAIAIARGQNRGSARVSIGGSGGGT